MRLLCLECRQPYDPGEAELAEIGLDLNAAAGHQLYMPKGCNACNDTGYRGRIGIFEMMLVDDELRAMVSTNVDSKTIKHRAVAKGMHTLRNDGARKVGEGLTAVSEVLRATEAEGNVAQV